MSKDLLLPSEGPNLAPIRSDDLQIVKAARANTNLVLATDAHAAQQDRESDESEQMFPGVFFVPIVPAAEGESLDLTIWNQTLDLAKSYFQSKGVDEKTIAHWTRPDEVDWQITSQENQHLSFVYTELIKKSAAFDFKFTTVNPMDIGMSEFQDTERRQKFENYIQKGTPYFKGS